MTLERVSAPRPSPRTYGASEACLVRNPIIIVAVIAIIILFDVVRGSERGRRSEEDVRFAVIMLQREGPACCE